MKLSLKLRGLQTRVHTVICAIFPNKRMLPGNYIAPTLFAVVSTLALSSCHLDKLADPGCDNPPKANFTMDTTACETPCTIRFSNTSEGASSFKWVFGNGNSSDRKTPPPQYYIQSGVYKILLSAEDEAGCQDTISRQILVKKPVDYPLPLAAFTSDKTICTTTPCTITFNNNSTGATDYIWDFGDGTTPVKPTDPATISHTFHCSGTFPVALTASNPKWSHTDTLWIKVTTDKFIRQFDHQGFRTQVNVVRPASDGGYILAGWVEPSLNLRDAWLAKIDAKGEVQWTRTYDYTPFDGFQDLKVLPNGQYVALGYAGPNSFKNNILFARFDNNGEPLDKHRIIGNLKETEIFSSFMVNPSGECILAGVGNIFTAGNQYFFVFKVSGQGDSIWMKKTEPRQSISPRLPVNIVLSPKGEYIFSGYRLRDEQDRNNWSLVLGSITDNGNLNWFRTCGRSGLDEITGDLKILPDGGLLLAGAGRVPSITNYDLYMAKTNEAGLQIDDLLVIEATGSQFIYGVEILPDDQYIVMGSESISTGNSQLFMRRIDWNGKNYWKKTYTTSGANFAAFLQPVASDCGYILVGNDDTNGKVWIIKTDAEGNEK